MRVHCHAREKEKKKSNQDGTISKKPKFHQKQSKKPN